MPCRPTPTRFLLFLLLHLAIAQRRGGGGGGGGEDVDGDDDFDWDDNGGGGSGGGGGTTGGAPTPPCDWDSRHAAFGLPGLYYNGTLTIRHHITANTAWSEEIENEPKFSFINCQNDDRSVKTYSYPAHLLIAPTYNDSDTNPFHWQLRAYDPRYWNYLNGNIRDFEQRWVYIRSSDFATNETMGDYSEAWPIFNPYRHSDATQLNRGTRVYWQTNVTSEGGGIYASSAEYSQAPPVIDRDDFELPPSRFLGRHSSQYVTLSDVCVWNQVTEDSHGNTDTLRRSEISVVEHGIGTTSPTLWLTTGAAAAISGIGSYSAKMSLNNSLEKTVPLSGGRIGGCGETDHFELSHFGPIYSEDEEESAFPRPWNLTLNIALSFEGSIIEENSTGIDGMDDGKLLFASGYDSGKWWYPDDGDDDAGSRMLPMAWTSLIIGLLLRVLVLDGLPL